MQTETCFLSIEEDKPLGIWYSDNSSFGVLPLEEVFEDATQDMSKERAAKYAKEFRKFSDELQVYSESEIGKLNVHDFIRLLRKADTEEQLQIILDTIEAISRTDDTLIVNEDWVLLTEALSQCRK